jgi:hypothetical protein
VRATDNAERSARASWGGRYFPHEPMDQNPDLKVMSPVVLAYRRRPRVTEVVGGARNVCEIELTVTNLVMSFCPR